VSTSKKEKLRILKELPRREKWLKRNL